VSERADPAVWFLLLIVVTAGTALRAFGLGMEVVLGDEMWAVRSVVGDTSVVEILRGHYGHKNAVSAPFALWYYTLMHTVGLDEWGFRLPMLVSGLLLLAVCWGFTRRRFGALEALAVVGLVAFSPAFVLYSRFARPYGAIALLSFAAWAAWLEWRDTRDARWGLASALAGAVAIYLHPIAAPAMVAVWGLGFASDAWNAGRERNGYAWRRSLAWMSLGCGLTLLLYLPSASVSLDFATRKSGSDAIPLATWWNAVHFLLGTRSTPPALWLIGSGLLGAGLVWRTQPWAVASIACMAAASATFVAVATPRLADWGIVTGRYLIGALPGLLLLIGIGLAAQGRLVAHWASAVRGRTAAGWSAPLSVSVLLAIVACVGPLPSTRLRVQNFANHPEHYTPPYPSLRVEAMPDIYQFLASLDDAPVMEVPWPQAYLRNPYAAYQERHGQRVRTAAGGPVFREAGVRFATVIPIETLRTAELSEDYVIIHRALLDENEATVERFIPAQFAQGKGYLDRVFREARDRARDACEENPELRLAYQDRWTSVYARGPVAEQRLRDWLRESEARGRP
jgi:hypothetical protein